MRARVSSACQRPRFQTGVYDAFAATGHFGLGLGLNSRWQAQHWRSHTPKASYDRVVVRGDLAKPEFVAVWLDR